MTYATMHSYDGCQNMSVLYVTVNWNKYILYTQWTIKTDFFYSFYIILIVTKFYMRL